jgi:hypothetical protein
VIAGDGQDVPDAAPLQLPGERKEPVAASVPAGYVDDHVLAARQELFGEERRVRHRVAAGVVRD